MKRASACARAARHRVRDATTTRWTLRLLHTEALRDALRWKPSYRPHTFDAFHLPRVPKTRKSASRVVKYLGINLRFTQPEHRCSCREEALQFQWHTCLLFWLLGSHQIAIKPKKRIVFVQGTTQVSNIIL